MKTKVSVSRSSMSDFFCTAKFEVIGKYDVVGPTSNVVLLGNDLRASGVIEDQKTQHQR